MRFYYLLFLLLFISCKNNEESKEIIVEGKLDNFPAKNVYITDANQWSILLDSAVCENGRFVFNLSRNKELKEPSKVSICYFDSSGKLIQLSYKNYILSTPDKEYSYSAFITDWGKTTIEGSFYLRMGKISNALNVTPNKETSLMYEYQLQDICFLRNKDSVERSKSYQETIEIVKKHSDSYYLLRTLNSYRDMYKVEELKEVYSYLDTGIQRSDLGKALKLNIDQRSSWVDQPLPNLELLKVDGSYGKVIDTNSKVNVIVFWASWCGPCRKEVPNLGLVFDKYKNKGLNLVSISIDEHNEQWIAALKKDKPTWEQYLVDSAEIKRIEGRFLFSAIPTVIITNNKGKELERLTGYDNSGKNILDSVVAKFLL